MSMREQPASLWDICTAHHGGSTGTRSVAATQVGRKLGRQAVATMLPNSAGSAAGRGAARAPICTVAATPAAAAAILGCQLLHEAIALPRRYPQPLQLLLHTLPSCRGQRRRGIGSLCRQGCCTCAAAAATAAAFAGVRGCLTRLGLCGCQLKLAILCSSNTFEAIRWWW